jgi:transposase
MKEDIFLMNGKERQRKATIEAVKNKHFTQLEAAERLHISERQVRRILRRHEREGDKGLVHGHRGKPSNHTCHLKLKTLVLKLYQTKYMGFGPTLAAEKITDEDKCPIIAETLRLWLKAEGLWDERRKRSSYRKQRKRREQFGDLLQLDGSFHHWFGDNYPTACLMNLVDDATGITMALLDKEETTEAAMKLLQKWIERYGIPKSIYVDLKTVYVSPKTLKHGDVPNELTAAFTHFSKACAKLGIKIIKAYSPQAKGRVERKHAVFQDRFVKELQLKNTKNIVDANTLLENNFLDHINRKFAKAPASVIDAHRGAKIFGDLGQIFCWEYARQVQNDWTISFENTCYQIQKSTVIKLEAKQRIMVRQHLNGSVSLWHGEHCLAFEEVDYKITKAYIKKGHDSALQSKIARENKHKSPWSQFNSTWLNSKEVANKRSGDL